MIEQRIGREKKAGHKGNANIAGQSLLYRASKVVTPYGGNGNDYQIDPILFEEFPAYCPVHHGRITAPVVCHLEYRVAALRKVVIDESYGVQAKFGRALKKGKNAPAGSAGSVDKHPLYAMPSRMQVLHQHVHQGLLGKQEKRYEQEAEQEQRSGKEEVTKTSGHQCSDG